MALLPAMSAWSADGALDAGFGDNGKVFAHFPPGEESARAAVVQGDGKMVVAGRSYNGSNYDFALARYNADGSLDSSFGGGGKLTTAFGESDDIADSIALQSDGKIIVAGHSENSSGFLHDFALARYHPDGSLDSSFDGDGKLTLDLTSDSSVVVSVAVQSDGKIVAAGTSYNGANDPDFAVVRFNADGSLDGSFNGDGKSVTDFAGRPDFAESMVVQTDGKIVVAGRSYNGSNFDVALARYNADGSLDSSFDGDGKLTTAIGSEDDSATAIALQADGKIVLAGYAKAGYVEQWALARYLADGRLDTGFDGDGMLVTEFGDGPSYALSVVVQADGKIVAAGSAYNEDFVLVRYSASGALDSGFDGDGRLSTDFGGSSDGAYSVVLQGDGKIVGVGGSAAASNGSVGLQDFALARYRTDGRLDSGFGGDGRVTTDAFQDLADVYWSAIVPQGDGRIVVAGASCLDYGSFECKFALARYLADGRLDSSFGGDGKVQVDFGSAYDFAYSIAVQGDGKIVVAGVSQLWSDEYFSPVSVFALARLHPDGSLDSSFDGDGKLVTDFGGFGALATSVVLQGDGKILLGGYSERAGTLHDFALARYHPDGRLDSSFGDEGKLTFDFGNKRDYASSIALQDDGRIVLAGTSYGDSGGYDFALARFNSNGSPDSGFADEGRLTAALGNGDDYAYGVALQRDGKIVLAGYSHNGADSDFALARFDVDGALDSTFGSHGKVTLDFGSGDDIARAIAFRRDGKVTLAGYSHNGSGIDFAVARFNGDGSLDSSFDSDGRLSTAVGSGYNDASALTLQDDGKVLVAGHAEHAGGAVVRYLSAPPPIMSPTAPRIGTAIAGNGQATVAFGAPGDNGGSTITRYTATSSPGGLAGTCSRSPCTVPGLSNGASYTFSVTATNSAGTGPSSAVSNSVVPMAPQSIQMAEVPDLEIGDSVSLSATGGGSGNPVVFTSRTASVCSVSGIALTALTEGECTIAANQAGSAAYHPAPEVTQSIVVTAVATGARPDPSDDFYAVASGRSTTIPAEVGVLSNDQFENRALGRALSSADGAPQHGALSLDEDGGFFYAPNTGYEGSDSFSYRACVGETCSTARVELSVVSPLSVNDQYLWLVPPASNEQQQGFIRLTNRDNASGTVTVWGIDTVGRRSTGTITLTLGPKQSTHFNSQDLELGNATKGLSGSLGAGDGNWLLVVRSTLDIDALAYIRTPDGFVTSMHDRVEGDGVDWVVPMFNPASNPNQVSRLRVVNSTLAPVDVQITGIDDAGQAGQDTIATTLPPLASREYDATDLEQGNTSKGLIGQLGDGEGKWRLTVSASDRITVQSLLADPMGYLTNLSTFSTSAVGDDQVLWMVTPAEETQQQGFLRLTNLSNRAGTVSLWGVDDRGQRSPGTATLTLGANATQHLNSQDLEHGNAAKGLSGSLGDGEGDWRIFLSTDLDLLPMGLIRTPNGFVTTMHDLVLETSRNWRVPMFNPGSNPNQVSVLRVVNPGSAAVNVSIAGVDDAGQAGPGGTASFTLAANAAVEFTAAELEQGSAARGLVGSLGDGNGKWWLQVSADAEIKVISMLRDPNGYLTNLSNETRGGADQLDP